MLYCSLILSFVVLNFVYCDLVDLGAPVLATNSSKCEYQGKFYDVGDFQNGPCQPCQCTSTGRVFCAIVDCFFQACADPVKDPKQCCPQCPNGRTCRAPDGHIIKAGETYQQDPDTICSCSPHSFGVLAECAHRLQPITAMVVS